MRLLGGYAGVGEPDPNLRDIKAFETILSADLFGDDIPPFLNHDDNTFHVVTYDGPAPSLLDGVTVEGGLSNGDDQDGAAIAQHGGQLAIESCTFRYNLAFRGGAIFTTVGSIALTRLRDETA